MKKKLACILVLTFGLGAFAQNEKDVLRYSTADYQGTARYEAMAGSFGALGADFSSMLSNPAGMARYSKSQFAFSFRNNFINQEALYQGSRSTDNSFAFKTGAMGMVITTDQSNSRSGIMFSQFYMGYTRLNNYHSNTTIKGDNYYTLLDEFADYGYGISPNNDDIYYERPFTTGLAYDVYMLDYDGSTGEYYPNLNQAGVHQTRSIKTRGGMGEFNLGASANYMNRIYIGGSINYRVVRYKEDYSHTESPIDTNGLAFRQFNYDYNLKTKGGGVNIKLGALFLPSEKFRVGLAIESPTFFNLRDEYTANMTSIRNVGGTIVDHFVSSENVPTGSFEYRLRTPFKTRVSMAYVFLMKGAINFEIEHMSYKNAKLKSAADNLENPYDFEYENKAVKKLYRNVINMRVGIEYSIAGSFFLRGGIAYLPSPYKKEDGVSRDHKILSAGLGKKWKNSQIDIAYKYTYVQSDYYMMNPNYYGDGARLNNTSNAIILSYTLNF